VRALAIVALLTAVAAAEPEAERLYNEGQSAYDAQRYDDALAAWNKSYELSHLPGLVFNIAQAHRLRGDCAKAVEAYKKFIALDPKSSERSTAEGFIKDLSPCPQDKPSSSGASSSGAKSSGANTSGANTGGANTGGANTGGANTGGTNTGGANAGGAKMTTGSSPNGPTTGSSNGAGGTNGASGMNGAGGASNGMRGSSNAVDTGHGKRIAGLAFGGGGVAIAATGLYFGSRAQALADDVRKACGTSCAYPSIRDKDQEGRRDETIQWILYGAGAAAVVTGGILYLTGKRSSSVAIAPHGDGAVMTLSGRW
jgi:tetratricopeptide (TPR) repeat protein